MLGVTVEIAPEPGFSNSLWHVGEVLSMKRQTRKRPTHVFLQKEIGLLGPLDPWY